MKSILTPYLQIETMRHGSLEEECEEIQRFSEAAEGYPVDVDLETQGFYRCNDAGTLPGECADFIFHKCND